MTDTDQTTRTSRKRALVAGSAVLLLAGITTGGALVTTKSTIFDNLFQTEAGSVLDGELLVTGDSMSHSFTGSVSGESTTKYYKLTNTSPTKTATVNVGSLVQDKTSNNADLLTKNLDTQVGDGGTTHPAGKLSAMDLGANTITVPADSSKVIRVDVFVKDATDFQAAAIGDDAQAEVDFQFDTIFS